MTETTIGREPVILVELVQPLCANTFGSAPCTASTSNSPFDKCHNTRATCQDTDNYDGSSSVSLFFAKGHVAERGISGAPYIIPSLVSVSTAPTVINLTASSRDATGLGTRAVANITFQDHPHSDRVVDPYLAGRAYDPMTRGSFWSKWMKRNKFRYNMAVNIYEGYAGQTLAQMNKRSYILTGASGPDESGAVQIQAKDILAKLEERKAQAPEASNGVLVNDITNVQTTIEVGGADIAEYPATGTVRIADELMTYSARAVNGDGNLDFTISARGTDNTVAAAHTADDSVQWCLRYTAARPDDVVEDLCENYGLISSALLDTATSWVNETDNYLSGYALTTVISEPVSVSQLIAELQEQVGFYIWWDERAALVKMKAVRGVGSTPPLITDEFNFIEGTFSITDLPKNRVSQVWFAYDQRDPTKTEQKVVNYRQLQINADLASETDEQYGEKSIRKIFSRWIVGAGPALSTSSKITVRYGDVPRRAKFRLDAKDRTYWTGDQVRISHFLDVDEFGNNVINTWTIISAEEIVPGEEIEYVCDDTTLYGTISVIQAGGAADYTAGDSKFLFWIGDANGKLSDGTECSRIT